MIDPLDQEAVEKAKWLSAYCKHHDNKCKKCFFNHPEAEDVYKGKTCILKRTAPDQWVQAGLEYKYLRSIIKDQSK